MEKTTYSMSDQPAIRSILLFAFALQDHAIRNMLDTASLPNPIGLDRELVTKFRRSDVHKMGNTSTLASEESEIHSFHTETISRAAGEGIKNTSGECKPCEHKALPLRGDFPAVVRCRGRILTYPGNHHLCNLRVTGFP